MREPAFYATASDWLKLPETGHLIRAYRKLRWEEDMCVGRRAALRGHAPRTEAKTAMINAGLNPTIGYVRAVIDGTYGVAQWPDLMCPGDIVAQLNTARESGDIPRNAPTPGAHSAGAWMVENFNAVALPVGKDGKAYPAKVKTMRGVQLVRLYAIRRQELYQQMTPTQLGEKYIRQTRPGRRFDTAG